MKAVTNRMNKKERVKHYYDSGLWSKVKVGNAVLKGWINADDYREITGEAYGEAS